MRARRLLRRGPPGGVAARAIAFTVLAALIVLAACGWTTWSAYRHARSGLRHLDALVQVAGRSRGGVTASDVAAARAALHAAGREFVTARQAGRVPAALARVHPSGRAAAEALEAVHAATVAGLALLDALDPLITLIATPDAARPGEASAPGAAAGPAMPTDPDAAIGVRLARAAVEAAPRLRSARQQLAAARAVADRVDARRLPAPYGARFLAGTSALSAALDATDALLALPDAMGVHGPRRYLILAQNPATLRATGGYTGSAVAVTLVGGLVQNFTFYSLSGDDEVRRPLLPGVVPPAPLATYVTPEGWRVEDANWFPDFPTSATMYDQAPQIQSGGPLSGVVAIDTHGMQALLRVIGPVRLDALGETITAQNVVERADFYEGRGDPAERVLRQDLVGMGSRPFFAILASALLERVMARPPAQLPALAAALGQAASEKQLIAAMRLPLLADVLARRGWDGRQRVAPGDYLMVVDTNINGSKVSLAIHRRAQYDVTLQANGTAIAMLRVEYTHTMQQFDPRLVGDTRDNDFGNYLRVYVPRGAALQRAEGFASEVAVYEEAGFTVFGGYAPVSLAQSRTIQLTYRLPPAAWPAYGGRDYHLRVQKQPGVPPLPLEATLHLGQGLMAGAVRTTGALRAPPAYGPGTVRFSVSLTNDAAFVVPLSTPKHLTLRLPPPRPGGDGMPNVVSSA